MGVAAGLLPAVVVECVTGAGQRWPVDTVLVQAHADLADTLVAVYHRVRPDRAASIVGRHADLVLDLLARPMLPTDRRQLEAIAVGALAQAGRSAFHAADLVP